MTTPHPLRTLRTLLALALTALTALAQAAPPAPAEPEPSPAKAAARALPEVKPGQVAQELPLSRFMLKQEPMMLRNARGEYELTIPITRRARVDAAQLHIEWTNSISLLAKRSQLAVFLGEQVLAQARLDPQRPEGALDVRLPANLFALGYNKLRFAAAQHYTDECEDPSAPELWTQINPVASKLIIQSTPLPLTPKLSELDDLFDPKQWQALPLHIALPAVGALSPAQLQWGALIAEGAALRLKYLPLHVTCSAAIDPATDNVLAGTRKQLAARLPADYLAQIQGAFLAIHALPEDPTRFLLVLSGRDEAEVSRAVRAFTLLAFPFPDAPSTRVDALAEPKAVRGLTARTLEPSSSYHFSDLGFASKTLKGMRAGDVKIEFDISPDYYANEQTEIALALHFTHGTRMRADSVVNILLNGLYERAIPIGGDSDGVFRNYRVGIPLRSMLPGRNVIEFSPQMMPLITGHCEAIQEENLLFSLFADSRIELPGVSRYAALPDLSYTARAAFPQLAEPDGSGLAVQVADADFHTAAAAWMLLAKLAQKAGYPLSKTEISTQLPRSKKHLLVIGSAAQLDPGLMKAAPVQLGQSGTVKHPAPGAPLMRETLPGWFGQLRKKLGYPVRTPEKSDAPWVADLTQTGSLGELGLTLQFESPLAAKKVAWVVTAQTPELLAQRVETMIGPDLWDRFQGDAAVWQSTPESLSARRLGSSFHVGTINPFIGIEFYFSQYPWIWMGTLVVLLSVFAWLTLALLRRFKKQHHGTSPEVESKP